MSSVSPALMRKGGFVTTDPALHTGPALPADNALRTQAVIYGPLGVSSVTNNSMEQIEKSHPFGWDFVIP